MNAVQDAHEREREACRGSYRQTIAAVLERIERNGSGLPVASAIAAAHSFVARQVAVLIDEAAGLVRVERGLPAFAEEGASTDAAEAAEQPHHVAASARAEDTLRHHEQGDIEPDTLEDLLIDLLHWAGEEGFGDALSSARDQFEAESEEDDANEAGPEPGGMTEEERQRARPKVVQLSLLRAHNPQRFDA